MVRESGSGRITFFVIVLAAVLGLGVVTGHLELPSFGNKQKALMQTAEYKETCHGLPLLPVEERVQALKDDYDVDHKLMCITKKSYLRNQRLLAKWQGEHSSNPQAPIEVNENTPPIILPPPPKVEANTAAEAELANVIGIRPGVAAKIVEERQKGPFKDWNNLTDRMNPITRVMGPRGDIDTGASFGGLVVNGKSLPDGEPNANRAVLELMLPPYGFGR